MDFCWRMHDSEYRFVEAHDLFLGLMSAEIGPLGQNETFQISLFCSALVIVFFIFCALVIVFCISLQCKRNNNLSTLQPEKAIKEY